MNDRREFFRLDLWQISLTIWHPSFQRAGFIKNISAGGLAFRTIEPLPLKKDQVVELFFQLEEKSFTFQARMVREIPSDVPFQYAFTFDNPNLKITQILLRQLIRMEAKKR